MPSPARETLTVLPALPAFRDSSGRVLLTRKFLKNMATLQRYWEAPVAALLEQVTGRTDALDPALADPAELPFELTILDYRSEQLRRELQRSAVVLGSASYRQNDLSRLCASLGVPCVYVTEHTLRTRWQAVLLNSANHLVRTRRLWWEARQELARRRAFRIANGLQCLGPPTYHAYRNVNRERLLVFNNRVSQAQAADRASLQTRSAVLLSGAPLRLAFSGRLVAIKGVDHLPRLAAELRRLAVPFTMTISGGGILERELRASIERLAVQDTVHITGPLDFDAELAPLMTHRVDLFVCCHLQGDPSSTYLETLSFGVPIVGYDNETLRGIVNLVDVGACVRMGDVHALALLIRSLEADRRRLVELSHNALAFAERFTHEQVFAMRVNQLRSLSST
jgi:colanic acid/amylovoran biosynthesis glycosyltransferase